MNAYMNSWGRFPTIHMSQRSLQLDTSSISEVLLLLEPADFLANITSLPLPGKGGVGQDADCGRQRLMLVQWHSSQVQMLLFSECPTPTSPPAPHPQSIWCWTVLTCGGGTGENTVASSNTCEKDVMLHRLWKSRGENIFCRTSLLPGRENQKQHLFIVLWGHSCCFTEN